ncbi:MAG: adenosylcobalamin-dependent ribonucleoside-diphosphate reductase [Sulfuricella sp.]
MSEYLSEPIARRVWEEKYRYRADGVIHDAAIEDTWRRVGHALAAVEKPQHIEHWEEQFYALLQDFKFLPGGRILAGAGTRHHITLFNCFVMGAIEDSIAGIFEALKESALTMQQGGGIGLDFSTLRPQGVTARGVGVAASGPLSFMHIWDSMCATILSTGARRGAMMATLRCDHPDIEAFAEAKRDPHALRHFNLSVLVSDDLMDAVARDAEWPLLFPLGQDEEVSGEIVVRRWSGMATPQPCRVVRKVGARALWQKITAAAYDCAEPGVIFIDRVNRSNNLWYCEHISATNPCGEIPLPAYGACDLGALNLTRFVREPFSSRAAPDLDGIGAAASIATRMLDNVYEASGFPLHNQAEAARATRRLGLGLTGLADALIMLGIPYGSAESFRLAGEIMGRIAHAAYRASIALAREKGTFPLFDREKYLQGEFVRSLPEDIRQGIGRHGIRNSHLTAIAPTGTISLLAGNVSSGLEPVYDWRYQRSVRAADGRLSAFETRDYAYALYRSLHGEQAPLTPVFVTAAELPPAAHLGMQAALQAHVDNAISKTVNVAEELSYSDFSGLYRQAYERGLKGCTVFRPNAVTGQVLTASDEHLPDRQCCSIEREAD